MSNATPWSQYLEPPAAATHHSDNSHYSSMSSPISPEANARANPSAPRRTNSYHANAGEDTPAMPYGSAPPAFSPTYQSSNHSYSSGGAQQYTPSGTQYGYLQSVPPSQSWSARPDTHYTEDTSSTRYFAHPSAVSSSEYSHSSAVSVNPAFITPTTGSPVTSHQQPMENSYYDQRGASSLRFQPRNQSDVQGQGVLEPTRIQYTDSATDRETAWLKRRCHSCGVTTPPGWRKSTLKPGKIVCNACGLYEKQHNRPRPTRLTDDARGGIQRRISGNAVAPAEVTYARGAIPLASNNRAVPRTSSGQTAAYAPAYASSHSTFAHGHGQPSPPESSGRGSSTSSSSPPLSRPPSS